MRSRFRHSEPNRVVRIKRRSSCDPLVYSRVFERSWFVAQPSRNLPPKLNRLKQPRSSSKKMKASAEFGGPPRVSIANSLSSSSKLTHITAARPIWFSEPKTFRLGERSTLIDTPGRTQSYSYKMDRGREVWEI